MLDHNALDKRGKNIWSQKSLKTAPNQMQPIDMIIIYY